MLKKIKIITGFAQPGTTDNTYREMYINPTFISSIEPYFSGRRSAQDYRGAGINAPIVLPEHEGATISIIIANKTYLLDIPFNDDNVNALTNRLGSSGIPGNFIHKKRGAV